MEGVIVLAENTIYSYSTQLEILGSFFLALGIVSGLIGILGVVSGFFEGDFSFGIIGVIFLIIAYFSTSTGFITFDRIEETKMIDYIEQKVIIEDTVSMNDFLKYYEILDQDGKIYIVKEKPIE